MEDSEGVVVEEAVEGDELMEKEAFIIFFSFFNSFLILNTSHK